MQSLQRDTNVMLNNFQKKEKVPLKLSAIKKIELPLAQYPSEIAEPLVIAITCGTRSTQLVISRPIGQTQLNPKADWVLTPIEEVETAIAIAEDPNKGKKAAARKKLREDALVAMGELISKGGKLYYKKENLSKVDIASLNSEINREFNEAKRIAKEQYLAECAARNQKPKRDWKYGVGISHFIPEEIKAEEKELEAKLKENLSYQEALEKVSSYETLVGTNRDTKQRKLQLDGECTVEQLVDIVKKKLITVLTVAPPEEDL